MVLNVPQYEGLSIQAILDKGKENDRVADYLPDERDFARLPRSFIVNVTFTLMGDPFKIWVHNRIKERNEKIAEGRNLIIELDPAVAKAFRDSVNISSKSCSLQVLSAASVSDSNFLCSKQRQRCASLEIRHQEKENASVDSGPRRLEVT